MSTQTEDYTVSVELSASPSTTIVVQSDQHSEFENFEDLAQKLVKVPKDEIDEKRKES